MISLSDWKVGQASEPRMQAGVSAGFFAGDRPILSAGKCMEQVWWFTLWLLVGLAACIGTILAMFAWTDASL
jgi:hypothetical protein